MAGNWGSLDRFPESLIREPLMFALPIEGPSRFSKPASFVRRPLYKRPQTPIQGGNIFRNGPKVTGRPVSITPFP